MQAEQRFKEIKSEIENLVFQIADLKEMHKNQTEVTANHGMN